MRAKKKATKPTKKVVETINSVLQLLEALSPDDARKVISVAESYYSY